VTAQALADTARRLVRGGKGLLAMDDSKRSLAAIFS
jgi:fructose-bisphosphate aldolase class 1